jgi:hypothetical protein
MPMKLNVNDRASRIASVPELRQKLAPFASQQFREIWLSIDTGGPSLGALMNTNVGVLTYLRHDEGDTGFGSRNPMYDGSDTLGGLAFDGLYRRQHVPVITYRLNGQEDGFPASWALPESDIVRALEYFVEHEGRRPPFVQWHDDAVTEPSHDITQPKQKGEFTVVLRAAGGMKLSARGWAIWKAMITLVQLRDTNSIEAEKQRRIIRDVLDDHSGGSKQAE